MQTFAYERASALADAIPAAAQPGTMVIAGGTELLNWMKDGIVAPGRLIDLNDLSGLDQIDAGDHRLWIGALARMGDVAAHAAARRSTAKTALRLSSAGASVVSPPIHRISRSRSWRSTPLSTCGAADPSRRSLSPARGGQNQIDLATLERQQQMRRIT